MKNNIARLLTALGILFLLSGCGKSHDYDAYLGVWFKEKGDYYFNGSLKSINITKQGENIFVEINCNCDVRGKFLAEQNNGILKINVPFQGDAYVVWLEEGKSIELLGDEFRKN